MLLTALVGSLFSAGSIVAPQVFGTQGLKKILPWIVVGPILNVIFNCLLIYIFKPATVGPLGGYEWISIPAIANTGVAFILFVIVGQMKDSNEHFKLAGIGATILLISIWVFMGIFLWLPTIG